MYVDGSGDQEEKLQSPAPQEVCIPSNDTVWAAGKGPDHGENPSCLRRLALSASALVTQVNVDFTRHLLPKPVNIG